MGLTHFDGLSVYGSGIYVGRKGSEVAMFPNAGLLKFDTGTASGSGHITSISTRLTSVLYATADLKGALPVTNSGHIVQTDWSGGAIDVYKYSVTGSASVSGTVAWLAIGS